MFLFGLGVMPSSTSPVLCFGKEIGIFLCAGIQIKFYVLGYLHTWLNSWDLLPFIYWPAHTLVYLMT